MLSELPRSIAIKNARIMCVVSDVHRFLPPLIAKSATSTLRIELTQTEYGGCECLWPALEPAQRQYRTFVFIREPVDRFLSAFYELTLRARLSKPVSDFVATEGGLNGISGLLDEIRQWGFSIPVSRRKPLLGAVHRE